MGIKDALGATAQVATVGDEKEKVSAPVAEQAPATGADSIVIESGEEVVDRDLENYINQINPEEVGSWSDALEFVAFLTSWKNPDTIDDYEEKDKEKAKKAEAEAKGETYVPKKVDKVKVAGTVGFQFRALKEIQYPQIRITSHYTSMESQFIKKLGVEGSENFYHAVSGSKDVEIKTAQPGELINLTVLETSLLFANSKINGQATGGEFPVNFVYRKISKQPAGFRKDPTLEMFPFGGSLRHARGISLRNAAPMIEIITRIGDEEKIAKRNQTKQALSEAKSQLTDKAVKAAKKKKLVEGTEEFDKFVKDYIANNKKDNKSAIQEDVITSVYEYALTPGYERFAPMLEEKPKANKVTRTKGAKRVRGVAKKDDSKEINKSAAAMLLAFSAK